MRNSRRLIGIFFSVFIFFTTNSALAETTASTTPNHHAIPKKSLPHSYADAVKLAAPAVVNVYAIRNNNSQASTNTPSRQKKPNQERPRRYGFGSGVIIDTQGYILTNAHVVRKAVRVLVVLPDGRKTPAKIIGTDPETDLAVLRIQLTGLKPIALGNSDHVEVGDIVLAIGNPFGLGQTVTQGIVSAIGRNTIGINQLEDYIQTDAAINPGNSGGALINTTGQLVGINTGIYSRSGGFQGVGFAIPVNVAMNIMNQIIKFGLVKRGWLGVRVRTLTYGLARELRSHTSTGVVVVEVMPNSPAAKIGLQPNDIITNINRNQISNAQGFLSFIAQREPGTTIRMRYIRNNKPRIVSVKVAVRPPMPVIDDRAALPGQKSIVPDDRGVVPPAKRPQQPKNNVVVPDDR